MFLHLKTYKWQPSMSHLFHTLLSLVLHLRDIPCQCMWWAQGSRGGNGSVFTLLPQLPTSNIFFSFSHNLMFCWPRHLSSTGENASTRRHSDDSIALEVRTQPLWAPGTSELTGKEASSCVGWGDSPWLPRGNWTARLQWREKEYDWNTGGVFVTMPCD